MFPKRPSEPSLQESKRGKWSEALKEYVENPNQPNVLFHDDQLVVLKDQYPKAKFHYLILPKKVIDSVWDLTVEDLPLLRRMRDFKVAEMGSIEHRRGFHAIPSMKHLHMHVLSTDMVSDCLKTKHHYLSFTTAFFIPIEQVIAEISNKKRFSNVVGQETFERLVKGPLKCHICGQISKSMPNLKKHLSDHQNKSK